MKKKYILNMFSVLLIVALAFSVDISSAFAESDEPIADSMAVPNLIIPTATPKSPAGVERDRTPRFLWTKVTGATNYRIQVKLGTKLIFNKDVTASVCGASNCATSSPKVLGYSDDYTWRVLVKVGGVWRRWSAPKSFRMVKTIPLPKSPSGSITDQTPTFTWTVRPEVQIYQLQLKKGTTTVSTLNINPNYNDCDSTTCVRTPSRTLTYGFYQWHMRAKVGGVWGPWSGYKNFKVVQPVQPAGFTSNFSGTRPGWNIVNGSWNYKYNSLFTTGVANKIASAYYNKVYKSGYVYSVRMVRGGCTDCATGIFIHGNPTPITEGQWKTGYYFLYNNIGEAGVAQLNSNGSVTWLKTWTNSNAINKLNWNTLKVTTSGTLMKFYINGTLVWQGNDASYTSGKVGVGFFRFTSSLYEEFYVDYAKLQVTSLTNLSNMPMDLSDINLSDDIQVMAAPVNSISPWSSEFQSVPSGLTIE